MIARIASIIVFLFTAIVTCAEETPPEQEAAVGELKGIASNLQKNRDGTVRFIRFSKEVVTDEHVALTSAFKQLDYLAVVVQSVTDQGLAHIGELSNLDTLFLSGSGITDATLARVGPLQKLEHLYLDRTQATDASLSFIAELDALKTLSLAETEISDEGISFLISLKNLETVILSDTTVTDAGLQQLAKLPQLRVLILDAAKVTGTSLSALKELTTLEELSLRKTAISAQHVPQIADFKSLTHLDLRDTHIVENDLGELRNANPKLLISLDPPETKARNAFQRYLAGDLLRKVQQPDHDQPEDNSIAATASSSAVRIASVEPSPDFQRHVVPLLGRLGCNGRTCHGSFQGKGGFNLSMFGYDFAADLAALTEGDEPRVNVTNVGASLILNKPTSDEDHGGGQRFEQGGWEHQLLKRWISSGAKGVDKPAKLIRFDVIPSEVVFQKAGETSQLQCVAVWEDGTREDVTQLTRFQTNDDTVADVSADGLITCQAPGDTYIVSFYDNGIFSTQVMMPVSDKTGDAFPAVETPTEIDRLVVRKLASMGIEPSAVCSDEEFLRRVCLDVTGTLPSPTELRSFLSEPSPEKRQHKVDELLETDAYATWWSVKLADLTGSNSQSLGSTDMNSPASEQWNAWLKRRLEDNVGWDEIAAGIILATSRRPAQMYAEYAAEQSMHMKRQEGTDYTDLNNPMHYYWFRGNNQTETDRVLTFGYTFMGVRLQCAQCHKHPFDQWSKKDFEQFANVFKRIKIGISSDGKERQTRLKTKLGVPKKLDTAALRRQMYLRVSAEGLPIPWNEVYIAPPADKPSPARIPGGDEFDINDFEDPREPVFAWLTEKENPYFAPSFVNRVWAHYFGVGIVDPPDDFNMANPPTNKALLSWLSEQFIERGYDIKWLHQTIATSDTYQRSTITTATNRTDERNFSRTIVRRMPAEVTIDAILRATANDATAARYFTDTKTRKIGQHPRSYQARGIDYSLLVFGKPRRTTSCDCERQDQPTLLQSLYVRNDKEVIEWLERPDGWLMSAAKELKQQLSSDVKSKVQGTNNEADAIDDERRAVLIRNAYLRTLTREPNEFEMQTAQEHIAESPNTVEGLRDIMWALLNTQEFLTKH